MRKNEKNSLSLLRITSQGPNQPQVNQVNQRKQKILNEKDENPSERTKRNNFSSSYIAEDESFFLTFDRLLSDFNTHLPHLNNESIPRDNQVNSIRICIVRLELTGPSTESPISIIPVHTPNRTGLGSPERLNPFSHLISIILSRKMLKLQSLTIRSEWSMSYRRFCIRNPGVRMR